MNDEVMVYEWADREGIKHSIPEGSCVICKHCTDIFLDPWHSNAIYACVCHLGKDTTEYSRHCDKYERKAKDEIKEIGLRRVPG
jgi:hypothetical protein